MDKVSDSLLRDEGRTPTVFDQLFESVDAVKVSVLVPTEDISRFEVPVWRERLLGALRVLEVAGEDVRTF